MRLLVSRDSVIFFCLVPQHGCVFALTNLFIFCYVSATKVAVVDLTNLSELLAENPDIADPKHPVDVPKSNPNDPETMVEFDNVRFCYPTQSESSGLKGVSFKMKKGTTTAIVGPTGKSSSVTVEYENCRLLLLRKQKFEPCVSLTGLSLFLLFCVQKVLAKLRFPVYCFVFMMSQQVLSESTEKTYGMSGKRTCET